MTSSPIFCLPSRVISTPTTLPDGTHGKLTFIKISLGQFDNNSFFNIFSPYFRETSQSSTSSSSLYSWLRAMEGTPNKVDSIAAPIVPE